MKNFSLLLMLLLAACGRGSEEKIEPCITTNTVVPTYYKEYWLGSGLFIDCPLSAEMMSGQEMEMESRVDMISGNYNGPFKLAVWQNGFTYLVVGNSESVQFGVSMPKDMFTAPNYSYTVSLRWRVSKTETSCWSDYATIKFKVEKGSVNRI